MQTVVNRVFQRLTSGGVIPSDGPRKDDSPRKVTLVSRPVAGAAGRIFEQIFPPLNSLQKFTLLSGTPNPTHHWAIVVGDYVHELNLVGNSNIVYRNSRYEAKLWNQNEHGTTRYNDWAIQLAGALCLFSSTSKLSERFVG